MPIIAGTQEPFGQKGKIMPEKFKELKPPRGLARLGFRLPILLYRMGLGNLLGSRFILLTHKGRKSGLARKTVLEVVRYDIEKTIFIVAAGFGTESDWYQNIRLTPQVTVQNRNHRWEMIARFLTPEQAGEEMLDYARRYPVAFRELASFMGYHLNRTQEDIRSMGKTLPMVSFQLE